MYEETKIYRGIMYTVRNCAYHNDNPRLWENGTNLCIVKHRKHDFPNELNFNFNAYFNWDKSEIKEIEKDYHVFWIDIYDNGDIIKYSLSWTWIQCKVDTHKDVWFIAISKEIWKEKFEARKEAKRQLERYTNYCNWQTYEWIVNYWDWDREYIWPFYSDEAIEEVEEECKRMIDDYLKTHQKYEIEYKIILENKTEILAKNKKEAKEKVKKKVLSNTENNIWVPYKNLSVKILDSK